jgi:hypothetical protein
MRGRERECDPMTWFHRLVSHHDAAMFIPMTCVTQFRSENALPLAPWLGSGGEGLEPGEGMTRDGGLVADRVVLICNATL